MTPEYQNFLTSIDQMTPEWLDNAFRESGMLQSGKVTHVELERNLDAPMSNAACIFSVKYAPGSRGRLPSSFFFKNGRMYGEVSFHKFVAQFLPQPALVPCYYASFADELGESNLAFADIRSTHKFSDGITFEMDTYPRIMSVLANLHRQLWEHPEFKADGAIGAEEMNLPVKMALNAARDNFPQFVSALGDRLPPTLCRQYEKILATLPHPLWQARRDNLKDVTVVHGDVHHKNFAFPREPDLPIYFVDWGLWHIDLPTYDLAYLLALRTPLAVRAQIEMNCLKVYHRQLNIAHYSFQKLLDDYRLSILFHTIWPVFFQSFTPMEKWLPLFENIMQAFEEWQCEALL